MINSFCLTHNSSLKHLSRTKYKNYLQSFLNKAYCLNRYSHIWREYGNSNGVSILFKQGILLKQYKLSLIKPNPNVLILFKQGILLKQKKEMGNLTEHFVSILFKQGILLKQKFWGRRMIAVTMVSILFKQGILLKPYIFRGLLNCQRTKITI